MLWLLLLHIAALLMWCAALLYLPVLVLTAPKTRAAFPQPSALYSIERFVFTRVATPFALLAIVAGPLVFLWNGTTAPWLILKLTGVVGLVICHALVGLLILRAEPALRPLEQGEPLPARLRYSGYGLLAAIVGIVCAVLWLVLSKPMLVGN